LSSVFDRHSHLARTLPGPTQQPERASDTRYISTDRGDETVPNEGTRRHSGQRAAERERDWQLEHSMGGDLHAPKGTKRRKRTGRREDDERSEERDGGGTNSSRVVLHVVSIDDVHVHAHRPMDPSTHRSVHVRTRSFIRSFVHSFIRPCVLLAEIWSPAGGFFADPKNWRRNTVVAAVGIATVAAFIFKKSTSIEERHALPNHAIPSQRFAPQSFPRT